MTIDEYADWAATVAGPSLEPQSQRLAYLTLGLIGEAGEIADAIRNQMRDGTLNKDLAVYELGDLVYFWVSLCAELGHAPSAMLEKSRSNIEARRAVKAPTGAR